MNIFCESVLHYVSVLEPLQEGDVVVKVPISRRTLTLSSAFRSGTIAKRIFPSFENASLIWWSTSPYQSTLKSREDADYRIDDQRNVLVASMSVSRDKNIEKFYLHVNQKTRPKMRRKE